MSRCYTEMLIEMIDTGRVTAGDIVLMCMLYMSEADVRDMMERNELLEDDDG